MGNQPWASGPSEILTFAIQLLSKDTDTNRRLSFILIDNAVEQSIKTFLSLPQRINGIKVPRKRVQESFESFPSLIDLLEEYASEKVKEIDLGSIEWYHRLRNQLYHQGIGLTVGRDKVEIYSELAKLLFLKLFGAKIEIQSSNKSFLIGEFIDVYNRLENVLIELTSTHSVAATRQSTLFRALNWLKNGSIIPDEIYDKINRFRQIRNSVVHGEEEYKKVLDEKLLVEIKELTKELEEDMDIQGEV